MKQRVLTLLLIVLFVFITLNSTFTTAKANENSARAVPATLTLNFSGTTAVCKVSATSAGNNIALTMTLWHGSTPVGSWSTSGTSYVTMTRYCTVKSGESYYLTCSGQAGSETVSGGPVYGTCP